MREEVKLVTLLPYTDVLRRSEAKERVMCSFIDFLCLGKINVTIKTQLNVKHMLL